MANYTIYCTVIVKSVHEAVKASNCCQWSAHKLPAWID